MRNVEAGDLKEGILGIDTDVLYQWRDLVPTYEKRITRIESVHVEGIKVGKVGYVCRISGDERLPVSRVRMSGIDYESAREANEVSNAHNFAVV
ncbi:hypothetical protein QEH56_07090 [Pelagicoccus enzymogenes]|uniref:hypothetical protein n=1 Tax=Pelagicoccus enzymogenes TaxID=2773457 RepID=UPI00280E1643|nr:hypothetical protein [Pelagicoccus enzymogenes]MDQ8197905.1 hypothetical protein [Pelagicoccus enzymogenes]